MDESAQRVRADYILHFSNKQILDYLGKKSLRMDPNIFKPSGCTSEKEFVNDSVALGASAGWAISEVSPAAFACKWSVGRARPEEVAYSIMSGDLIPPTHVKEMVENMSFDTAESFTAYSEGCPVHPSWPAMHSAASSLSTWLDVVADLDSDQRYEVRLLDFSIAFFRTFAGVHYETDNRAGLALGRKIVLDKLPDHLSEKYGCDADSVLAIKRHVQNKIAALEGLDWATWTPPKWISPKDYLSSLPRSAYRFSKAMAGARFPRPGGAFDSCHTDAVSVRSFQSRQVQRAVSYLGADVTYHQLAADLSFDTNAAFKPTHADDADNSMFWSEFEDVVAAQILREQNVLTKEIMSVHHFFKNDTMDESAQRVWADYPPYFPNKQIVDYLGKKVSGSLLQ